jgi:hypothetical protein
MRRERLLQWRKSVEVELIPWPATTWLVTTSAKSVELPHGPISTPPLLVRVDTHTHHILEIPLANLSFLVYELGIALLGEW